MSATFAALAPIIVVIALGWALRHKGFPGEAFWAPAERLTYYVLFPALLVSKLAAAPLGALPVAPVAGALAGALLFGAALMIGLRRALGIDGPAFTSLFQGAIRLNSYAGLAAAASLYGQAGLTLAAVALAAFIPTVNVLSVAVLARHAGAERSGWREVGTSVVRNPLILACAAGAMLNAVGLGVPPGFDGILDVLGRAALPFGLLCVGAGLSFAGLQRVRWSMAAVCTVKLVVVPAVAAFACAVFGISGVSARVVVLFAALPTATSAYVLSREMGGDAPLMAQVVAVTHLGAVITLPTVLGVLG